MNKEEILYQIVAVDSEFKKGFPDEITTIFKNGITGKTYSDYDFKNHRYLYTFINDNFNIYDRLEEKDKEIERLNNKINKDLDKFNDELNTFKWLENDFKEHSIHYYQLECLVEYLKELKENK